MGDINKTARPLLTPVIKSDILKKLIHYERESPIIISKLFTQYVNTTFSGKMSDIMTHTLFNLYNAPEGFCFDFLCNDEPIIDDPDNKVYNADKRVMENINILILSFILKHPIPSHAKIEAIEWQASLVDKLQR